MSRKTERLVNLTIALLATKRYITKSEIFRTVDGYEGNDESKERMFERDKDDLRNLGIEIEVGTFDPLFEDESGYRIKPENYQFQLGEVNAQEITLLSLAAEAWRGASLSSSALSALNKLHAIGIESDSELLLDLAPAIITQDENLAIAIAAITSRTVLSFSYLNEELKEQSRALEPYAVISKYGHWYIFGNDLDRRASRLFRLDRVSGELKPQGKSSAFEIPGDLDVNQAFAKSSELSSAIVFIRDGRGLNLRSRGSQNFTTSAPIGWQELKLEYLDRERFIEEVLWYGNDVIVFEPIDLRNEILGHLKAGVATYG
ncbi:MAG: WYL domain-containing protein [Actinobacteria bacterium]|nr:WYL domain-containing protein [Actinomycetota bacterium]